MNTRFEYVLTFILFCVLCAFVAWATWMMVMNELSH